MHQAKQLLRKRADMYGVREIVIDVGKEMSRSDIPVGRLFAVGLAYFLPLARQLMRDGVQTWQTQRTGDEDEDEFWPSSRFPSLTPAYDCWADRRGTAVHVATVREEEEGTRHCLIY